MRGSRMKNNNYWQKAMANPKIKKVLNQKGERREFYGALQKNSHGALRREDLRKTLAQMKFDRTNSISAKEARILGKELGVPKIKRKYLGKDTLLDDIKEKKVQLHARGKSSPADREDAIEMMKTAHKSEHTLAGVDKDGKSPTIRNSFGTSNQTSGHHADPVSSAGTYGHLSDHSGTGRLNSTF